MSVLESPPTPLIDALRAEKQSREDFHAREEERAAREEEQRAEVEKELPAVTKWYADVRAELTAALEKADALAADYGRARQEYERLHGKGIRLGVEVEPRILRLPLLYRIQTGIRS